MKLFLKRFMMFAVIFGFALGFVACTEATTTATTTEQQTTQEETTVAETTTQEQTTVITTAGDTVGPVITGATDITIYVDAVFDPLAGITATDNVDGNLIASVTYVGVVDTSATGVYFIKYSVTDAAGNKTEASRYITVEVDPSLLGDEMVQNGDFSLGWAIWGSTSNVEGGIGTFTVTEGVLEVEVTAEGWSDPFPRLESNTMTIENGVTYEITFKAKADAQRPIKVQVGELLSVGPWFVDFKTGQTDIFNLTTEWQTFSFKFTMNLDTNENGQITFENGATIVGDAGFDNYLTTIYYDDITIVESTPDADTTAPLLTGADDVTIEVGTVFDPLDGVTAFDVVDGDITLDASHYVGTVDITIAADYTITYTVEDAAGNETIVIRVITVVALIFNETGLVVNGDFAAAIGDPAEWNLYEANWDPSTSPMSDGTLSIVSEELLLEVVNIGSWGYQGWLLQASQEIEFEVGQTYKISFKAKADAARVISAVAGFQDTVADQWHGYGGEEFDLTTAYQTFEFIFTVNEDNAEYLDVLKFEFGQAADTVYMDDVQVLLLDQAETVVNSDLSDIGWSTWSQDWDTVGIIDIAIVSDELVATISALGGFNYSIQLFQEGIELVSGTTYTITFDAKADVARDINLKLIDANKVEYLYVASLTTTSQTFTYTFLYDGTATIGKIDFEMGVIGSAVAGVVTFDNIAMTDGTTAVEVVNGTFDQTVGWSTWSVDASTTISVVNEELVVNIPNVGTEFWNSQLFQEGIALTPDAVYTIMFAAKADVARDMNVVLIAGGNEYRETFSLTTEMQTFAFSFTYDGTGITGKLDFELGAIGSAVGGVVTMDNIIVYRTFNPFEAAPEFLGIEAVTVNVDSTFDPLADVSAFDFIDGTIILDLTNVTGTVDTTTVGDYTLTYTVEDSAGNVTIVTRVVTVENPA